MLWGNVNMPSFSGDKVPLRLLLRMRFLGFFLWINTLHPQLTGQPVLIGGTMGTCSYVLTGTEQGMTETFGTTCHGAVSQKVISGRDWNGTVIQRTGFVQSVIHLLVIQVKSSLATVIPAQKDCRLEVLFAPSWGVLTTAAENLEGAALYKANVRMKMWRMSSFYQILVSLS